MKPSRRPISTDRNGFTLLELLIAMSLLGLIFAALTGGLRFGTTAWQKAADRLSKTEEIQLVHRTLRRQIATALPIPLITEIGEDRDGRSFDGRRDRVSFVGPAPAQAMAPGLFQLSLELVPDGGAQALTLKWNRLGENPSNAEKGNVEPILRGIRSIEFSYLARDRNGGPLTWVNEWRETSGPPRLMRISVDFVDHDRTPWPAMIIPLMVSGEQG